LLPYIKVKHSGIVDSRITMKWEISPDRCIMATGKKSGIRQFQWNLRLHWIDTGKTSLIVETAAFQSTTHHLKEMGL
jgi:hypothetical protein